MKERRLRNFFRTLLLREEDINYDSPFCQARWIDIKVNLLTCLETIEDIKKLLKEE